MRLYKWAYSFAWWDGPVAGMVRDRRGRPYWAIFNIEAPDHTRWFMIYDPPEDWWQEEDARHELWMECAGTYDFERGVQDPTRPLKDFYDRYPPSVTREWPHFDHAVELTDQVWMEWPDEEEAVDHAETDAGRAEEA